MELLTGTKTCWSKQAQGMYRKQNIAKAQRTRGLSSYRKITVHSSQILNICITISESQISVNFKISTKHQHRLNLNLKS